MPGDSQSFSGNASHCDRLLTRVFEQFVAEERVCTHLRIDTYDAAYDFIILIMQIISLVEPLDIALEALMNVLEPVTCR